MTFSEKLRSPLPSTIDDTSAPASDSGSAVPMGEAIERIWEAVLGPGSARDPQAGLFALGGDSLSAANLLARVQKDVGIVVEPELFFADPTFAALLNLIGAAPPSTVEVESAAPDTWPLSADQYRKQLAFVEQWSGKRPTADRLVAGFNATGPKPPIFIVCQVEQEAANLARHLGPHQPVFGLRSGHHIISYRPDEVQAFALRYVADVEFLCPAGPVLLAGVCQGGVVALAMAHHLLQRRRSVPLLALLEWSRPLHPYPGRVLLLHGAESRSYNPRFRFSEPERAWRRHFAELEMAVVPGGHWDPFTPEGMPRTAAVLADRFERALHRPAIHLADEHRRAAISLGCLPPRIEVGQTFAVEVSVANASTTPWTGTESSGLMLGYYWVDDAGNMVGSCLGRAVLPALAPSAPEFIWLSVTAPATSGPLSLVVDVVEEGNVWFQSLHPEGAGRAEVDVVGTERPAG